MLEAIGVRPDDEAVYREVLSRPEAEIGELAAAVGRGSAEIGRSLTTLEELGLVHRLPGRPVRLRAARPDVAVDALVNRRREELARTQLAARNLLAEMPAEERHRPEDIVEVLVGRPAIAARFDQLLDTTRHELMVLNRPPYVADPNHSENAVRRLLRADVTVRGIYAPEALELPGALEDLEEAARAGEQARVHADLPMKLAIGDGELAILPIDVDTVNAARVRAPVHAAERAGAAVRAVVGAGDADRGARARGPVQRSPARRAARVRGRRTTWSPAGLAPAPARSAAGSVS